MIATPNYSQDIPASLTLPPFDVLSDRQREQLAGRMNIHYFPQQARLIVSGERPTGLFILMKGVVVERSAKDHDLQHEGASVEVFTHYHQDDLLDLSSINRQGQMVAAKHDFVAVEDCLAYEIPNALLQEYLADVPQILTYLHGDIDQKLDLSKPEHHQNLAEFILTRITEEVCEPVVRVNPNAHLSFVLEQLLDEASGCLLVQSDGQEGSDISSEALITKTDVLRTFDRVAKDQAENSLSQAMAMPISKTGLLASRELISVELGDYLFNAMLLMTKHNIERVLVKERKTEGDRVVGVLYQTQLLSLFSTHSHVLSLRIAKAQTLNQLIEASLKLDELVHTLFNNGIKVQFLMSLVSTLNEMIIAKAFKLIMPEEVQQNTALMVMGSEGRGEQILKTDQDNALIIRDGFNYPGLEALLNQFSKTLLSLGYPTCDGKVMVNNPYWVGSLQNWQRRVRSFALVPSQNRLMELAILQDGRFIEGDSSLFEDFRRIVIDEVLFSDSVLAEYAATALKFDTPLTFWGNLKAEHDQIDIKQGGLFPIVHGIRAMALKHQVTALSTFDRIDELQVRHLLEPSLASKLKHSFSLFIRFRLQQRLNQKSSIKHRGLIDDKDHLFEQTSLPSSPLTNQLSPNDLNRTERDLLRQSLHTVKKFKQRLVHHFHLETR